ncbi:MAG TPA: M28 family peptidase [Pyrinomonadaceae bacterium]|jgi:Zn-dependent M28 family amino/carboxypeptidase|nr:M28 family peptidase [Pyrinomonadaceae bacterium]
MSKQPLRLFTIVFALVLPLSLLGCPSNSNKPIDMAPTNSSPGKSTSDFDGNRALEHVRKQVEFGPRPAGSAELEKTRGYIIDQLKSYGLNVTMDEFHPTTPQGQKKMVNVIAEVPGESSDVIILSSHYDTKYFKDFKFVGANDAGSSTGALIEIGRVLAAQKTKPKFTYWLVFFDGEEAFCTEWEDCKNPNPSDPSNELADNTYGSRHMVDQLIAKNELKRVRAMILLDMIGSKDLRLGRPELSTRWLVDVVWQTAREIGYSNQFTDGREGVDDDDHKPFLRAGVDALDIIQLGTYSYWHTKEDTLDKISAKSLKAVGDTMIVSLPKIEERLQSRAK